MPITYAEHAPGAGLADAVRCYWTISGATTTADAAPVNRVLPDNCIDVIVDLRGPTAFVVGTMLKAEVVSQFATVDLLGVRFCPGAATEFLDARASALAGAHVDAGDVWPDASRLVDQLLSSDPTRRPRVLDAWLVGRRRARRETLLARRAAAAIERSRGRVSAGQVAHAVGASDRTLLRAFRAAVGIGPKDALRVERFRAAAALLDHAGRAPSLGRVAAECGYADQSHLTREFNAIAGITPTAFLAERRLVGIVQD